LRYESLIIFLNRRCPVGCATCNADAQPTNNVELNPLWLADFFRKLRQEPLPFSGYILWTGGEPFYSFPSLMVGLDLAASAGYSSEILTSGIWFKSVPDYLSALAAPFKPRLRISLDAEHQEQVPVSLLISLIREAVALGLEVNFTLREIPGRLENSPRQSLEIIKQQLPRFYAENMLRSRWLHVIPHFPLTDPKPQSVARLSCRMAFRDLVIGEDGLVYPCCGFFSLPAQQRPIVGNALVINNESILDFRARHHFYAPCQFCISGRDVALDSLPS